MADEQQLFLIEFLVDQVNIPVVRAIHEELLPATTCVSFQILSLPPINIYQESSTESCGCNKGDTEVFKKGKSCLFALPSIVLQKPLSSFPVDMSVYKKLPPGVLPDVMLIGSHRIETKDLINALLTKQIFEATNPCKTMKDTFKIKTATGQCVGEVTVFLRASCFGKKIVTQFQIPHNRKPYLFKGADNSPVFQCKRIPSFEDQSAKHVSTAKGAIDGSGEAAIGACCPKQTVKIDSTTDVLKKAKQPDWGPRPCCPSYQSYPGSSRSGQRSPKCPPCSTQAQQVAHSGLCAPFCPSVAERPEHSKSSGCCAPLHRQQPSIQANCIPCCTPCIPTKPQIKKDSCSPCCGASSSRIASKTYKAFSDLLSKEVAVRKCGCAIKEEPSCNCARTT